MPSSTSSSDRVLLGAAAALALALCGLEIGWRQLGFEPSVRDGHDLWSVQRDRVYGSDTIVLLGASRMLYDVSIPTLREELPGRDVANLAIGGTVGAASLRDLAEDPEFKGIAILETVGRGFEPRLWSTQEPWIDFYHRGWNTEQRLSRWLETGLQTRIVLMNKALDLKQLMLQPIRFGRWLPVPNLVLRADRSVDARFPEHGTPDAAYLEATFSRNKKVALSPAAWLDVARVVDGWIRRIRERGGRVAVVRFPTSGPAWKFDNRLYRRQLYWNRFAAITDAVTLHFRDVPEFRELELPDYSHLNAEDKPAFTRVLVRELRARGLFEPRPSASP